MFGAYRLETMMTTPTVLSLSLSHTHSYRTLTLSLTHLLLPYSLHRLETMMTGTKAVNAITAAMITATDTAFEGFRGSVAAQSGGGAAPPPPARRHFAPPSSSSSTSGPPAPPPRKTVGFTNNLSHLRYPLMT